MPDDAKMNDLVEYLQEGEEVMLTISRTAFIMLSKEVATFAANLKYPNSERARDELLSDYALMIAELWSQIEGLAVEKTRDEPNS